MVRLKRERICRYCGAKLIKSAMSKSYFCPYCLYRDVQKTLKDYESK